MDANKTIFLPEILKGVAVRVTVEYRIKKEWKSYCQPQQKRKPGQTFLRSQITDRSDKNPEHIEN